MIIKFDDNIKNLNLTQKKKKKIERKFEKMKHCSRF